MNKEFYNALVEYILKHYKTTKDISAKTTDCNSFCQFDFTINVRVADDISKDFRVRLRNSKDNDYYISMKGNSVEELPATRISSECFKCIRNHYIDLAHKDIKSYLCVLNYAMDD